MSIPEREVLVRPNAEVRYETRTIQIRFEYKHSDGSKRRRGVNVDRKWIADEFGGGPLFIIEDRDGDDFWDFKHRAQALLMDELRAIAAEGWRLVQYVPSSYSSNDHGWPFGFHIFSRP